MLQLPIEIIYYILDFVDYGAATRFANATQWSDIIDDYLIRRHRHMFRESLQKIREIKYDIDIYKGSDGMIEFSYRKVNQRRVRYEYYERICRLGKMKGRRLELIIIGGKLNESVQRKSYLGSSYDIDCDHLYIRILKDSLKNKIYVDTNYGIISD